MQITVVLTCFNRKTKTLQCIKSLAEGNTEFSLRFVVVDDNSLDGTREALDNLEENVELIEGTGNLFWSGGMRKGIDWVFENVTNTEYVLLVNDDVVFRSGILLPMINKSIDNNDAVIVGATCDSQGVFTYGGMKLVEPRKRGIYRHVGPDEPNEPCDLFNCNCVLLKFATMKQMGNFDPVYVHGMADLDYGLRLSRAGITILSSDDYVGICEKNSVKGTWQDTGLSRIERLKRKESAKGAPIGPWFYYLKKNFGILTAIRYSLSSYARILLGK